MQVYKGWFVDSYVIVNVLTRREHPYMSLKCVVSGMYVHRKLYDLTNN